MSLFRKFLPTSLFNKNWTLEYGFKLLLRRYYFIYFIYFIYTIFQEGDTFGMKAILPCGPLNIKHIKNNNNIHIYK